MWAMGRDWYAQFLLSRGMYPEARKEFEASFKTCKELFGEGHSQSMVLLNSLGKKLPLCLERVEGKRRTWAIKLGSCTAWTTRQRKSDWATPLTFDEIGANQVKLVRAAQTSCTEISLCERLKRS